MRREILHFTIPLVCILLSVSFSAFAQSEEHKVYRTGLKPMRADIAVSPDGRSLILDVHQHSGELKLIDLSSKEMTNFPGRGQWPTWSPDGKSVAFISSGAIGHQDNLDAMQVQILDLKTMQIATLTSGDGFRVFPFFSADSTTIYYFKGKRRQSGKTPASDYDLFSISVAGGKEVQLTEEMFYQANRGNDDGNNIIFNASGGSGKRRFIELQDAFGKKGREALFRYEKSSAEIAPIAVDQRGAIFDFRSPRRDQSGALYFKAAKTQPGGGGPYRRFLVRSNVDGTNAALLVEMRTSMGFDVVHQSGEIYLVDEDNGELIIRKLGRQGG